MVFASPSGQFYHDMTNRGHLSGLSHLDSLIMTRKSCPSTGTLQKRMPTPTQTATPYTTGPLVASLSRPEKRLKKLSRANNGRTKLDNFIAKRLIFNQITSKI
jgi:hypothetical protein